jgi:hypothetical protein
MMETVSTASEVTATNFAIVSPAAGGVVAFWLTLWLSLLAGVIFLGCVFCHSKEAAAGMTARHALVETLKAACRGVLGLLLSGLLWCMRASGASVSAEEMREASSPAKHFTRLGEEAPEAPTPPPRGRREEVEAEAAEAEEAEKEEEARGAIEAIEARVEAFRSSSIEGKEVVEYRVQARTILCK